MDKQFENMQKLAFGKILVNESEKYSKSTLKSKIREMILDEVKKKKKKEPEDVAPQEDVDMSMDTEDTSNDTIAPETPPTEIDIDPRVKAIQDALNKALANAKELGDEKLVNQIGNTVTMLVRTQVVGQQATM
jgi:hypothetical protein